jgi:phytoene dehydrogenase-like protein
MRMPLPVVIVGAGLAGLSCALQLHKKEVPFLICEASNRVGGRVATDKEGGFTFDRGFQILLSAYPECQAVLNYDALDLHSFYPGAMIWIHGRLHKVGDPFRQPLDAVSTLMAPVGSIVDKIRMAMLKRDLASMTVEQIFSHRDRQTKAFLGEYGFSEEMIFRFFQPFLSGVFLEKDLRTSSKMFEFIFSMFAAGDACLPAQGMGAIPAQLASQLPAESIMLNTKVHSMQEGLLLVGAGEKINARAIVVATEGPEASRLLTNFPPVRSHSVTCLYYAAEKPPVSQPILILNGDGHGRVNHVTIPSNVCPSYAPQGSSLICVSVLGTPFDSETVADETIRAELDQWFKGQASKWKYLRGYAINDALPDQAAPALESAQRSVKFRPGIYVCGDHRDNGSIDGALASGRRAGEAILRDIFGTGAG